MSEIVKIQENQEMPASDLMNMQTKRRDQIDNLLKDAVDPTNKFAGFAITNVGGTAIIVSDGRLYYAGVDYDREADEGATFDLITGTATLPVVAGKIISLVGYGTVKDTNVWPREFETAVTDQSGSYTGEYTVESRDVAIVTKRLANLSLLPGVESANPAPPVIGNQYIEIARILCSSTGIVSITHVEANRLKTNKDLDVRVAALEQDNDANRAAISSLVSDIASLRKKLENFPSSYLVHQHSADIARIKEQLGRSDTATAYGSITFGTANEMDFAHAASMCRLDGTLTFADVAIKEALLAFSNPNEPLVVKKGTITLPVYNEVLVIDTMLGLIAA